jgi:hypothetical protein
MLRKTCTLGLLASALMLAPSAVAQTTTQAFSNSILKTPIALPLLPIQNFEFIMADIDRDGRPDLVAIKRQQTGTRRTEIHVLSAASRYRAFIVQTGTGLPETGDNFTFAMADVDRDGKQDLVAIKKNRTASKKTELQVFSGASNFQQSLLLSQTKLPETGDNFTFAMALVDKDDRPDLVAIKKSQTGTKTTEIHVLSGVSNFQQFIVQTGTVLPETGDNYTFAVADINGNGTDLPDLVAIKKNQTGTKTTEIHVVSGAFKYQKFRRQTKTILPETGDNSVLTATDLNRDGLPELVQIKKNQTGTRSTELHAVSNIFDPVRFIEQTGTSFGEIVDPDFNFGAFDIDRQGKPDLIAIQKNGSAVTQVRVLSGESNFQKQATPFTIQLPPSLIGNQFDYTIADWDKDTVPDLVVVQKNQTRLRRTTVQIFSGRELLLQQPLKQILPPTNTSLPETDDNFDFAMVDWDRDGVLDLAAVKKNRTEPGKTTVEILSGQSGFQQQILPPTNVSVPEVGNNFDFTMADRDGDGQPELIAIKKNQTTSGSTEVEVLKLEIGSTQ